MLKQRMNRVFMFTPPWNPWPPVRERQIVHGNARSNFRHGDGPGITRAHRAKPPPMDSTDGPNKLPECSAVGAGPRETPNYLLTPERLVLAAVSAAFAAHLSACARSAISSTVNSNRVVPAMPKYAHW